MKWAPIQECLREARTRRGFYECASCKEEVPASIKEGRKRVKNVHVDHIVPVVDPEVGWTTWDEVIDRLFSELDNLQTLCKSCHDKKTNEEKEKAKIRRSQENMNDS